MDYLKLFQTHEEYEDFVSGGTMVRPNVSHCVAEKDVHYTKKKFDNEYLTFEALESGKFALTIGSGVTTGDVVSVSYSLDNGKTWTTTNNVDNQTITITTPTVNAGDEVLWKGNANRMANNYIITIASTFSSTANFNARGNVMSLLYGDEFKGKVSLTGKNYCFSCLFRSNTKLNHAKNISLPAITLENGCYRDMFMGCKSLTTAPELPADTLAEGCYESMFKNCTSLTTAPELHSTSLVQHCYNDMFNGCTSLTTVPELPATTLTDYCYNFMFQGCTSLTTAPELPATALASNCYYGMFQGCKSLTVGPELPATTLTTNCYSSMFYGCTNLTTAPNLPATILAYGCYDSMFQSCTNLTVAPELPGTTLATYCYRGMFDGCTGLTTASELPAATLTNYCYNSMFAGCTSLTTAPELPADTLAEGCYQSMFKGCTSLTTAPELPATKLAYSCYSSMFNGCKSLTTAPALPVTTLAISCYNSMFYGCTSLTTAPELHSTALVQYCYYQMFQGCRSLTTAPELPADTLAEGCYERMFYNCTNLNYFKVSVISYDIITNRNEIYSFNDLANRSGKLYLYDEGFVEDTTFMNQFIGWTLYFNDEEIGIIERDNGGDGYGEYYPVYYNPIPSTTPKDIVGSVAYYDGSSVKFALKEDYASTMGTPIGVVVIPQSHMADNKCRVMSLANMSYKTPETGTLVATSNADAQTAGGANLMWGVSNNDIAELTNYDKVVTVDGATTESNGYLPSDYYIGTDGAFNNDVDTETAWGTRIQQSPSPYFSDGSKNPLYFTAGQVLCDMNGKSNTNILVNLSAIKTQTSGEFENVEANYPAAMACHMYHTSGTNQGDWYLPAMGELGYLYARAKKINETLTSLGPSAVGYGIPTNWNNLGSWLWSSSEYSGYYSRSLVIGGGVRYYDKSTNRVDGRVRAFAAF